VSPRRAALLPCLVATFLAACAGDAEPAATVDGTPITQQAIVDELEAIQGNPEYVEALEGTGARVLGEDAGAFDAGFVAAQLGLRIRYALVGNEVERRDLDIDDACRDAARDGVLSRLAGVSATGDGEDVLEKFPDEYVDYLVQREAEVLVLQGDLAGQPCVTDDAVETYYDEHRQEFQQACSGHILVATRAEADEIVALLRGGADFATVAAERSTDPGSAQQGGQLPCVRRGELIPEFESALFSQEVGVIGDPVETEFGFHVIRVDARQVAPLDEVRDQVVEVMRADVENAFGQWFGEAIASAEIDVDPRYGEWDASVADVVRSPEATPSTTTTTPAG
jgi:hypothetical protein